MEDVTFARESADCAPRIADLPEVSLSELAEDQDGAVGHLVRQVLDRLDNDEERVRVATFNSAI